MNILHQPAPKGDVVESMARRYYADGAKIAIAAIQPAIDKARAEAKAEERARIVGEIREHMARLKESDSYSNHMIAGFLGGLIIEIGGLIIDIKQGGVK